MRIPFLFYTVLENLNNFFDGFLAGRGDCPDVDVIPQVFCRFRQIVRLSDNPLHHFIAVRIFRRPRSSHERINKTKYDLMQGLELNKV